MTPATTASTDTLTAGRAAHSTSKLAVIHLVHELARRPPAGVDIFSWNPGFVPGTGLARDASAVQRFAVKRIMRLMTLTPLSVSARTAGQHLARLVLRDQPAENGACISLDEAEPSSAESYDPDRERELWHACDQVSALA
ncbi:hypothetical protein [Umezawaea beigongshangensis]|uniref:hypothetical protein n=1 Tax=Umezawaea beigongshangensis TaxID=2780383 RepID=UPI001E3A1181|nr:hypothetical protein [Umezawaea beigongshangensis]